MANPKMKIVTIPLPWLRHAEVTPAWPGAALRRWRWTVKIAWCYVGIVSEINTAERTWRPVGGYYLDLRRRWALGWTHTYYDGPNCALDIGPLSFQRSGANVGWCQECEGWMKEAP